MEPTTETIKTSKGLYLPCPCCGEEEASINLCLADMESFKCVECDGEFTLEYIHTFIAKWSRVAAWIESAPTAE